MINLDNVNTATLAFLGDAVYELAIRKMLVENGMNNADRLHRAAVKYVSAEGQSRAVKELSKDFLTPEEVRLVKRGRNHKTTSHPRNVDPRKYKQATGFEALLGYLELSGDQERLDQVITEAIHVINGRKSRRDAAAPDGAETRIEAQEVAGGEDAQSRRGQE